MAQAARTSNSFSREKHLTQEAPASSAIPTSASRPYSATTERRRAFQAAQRAKRDVPATGRSTGPGVRGKIGAIGAAIRRIGGGGRR